MLQRIAHPSGLIAYRSPALAALGVPHLMTTRIGPGGEPLDLREPGEEALAALRECAGIARSAALVALRQVHGAAVHEVGERALDDVPGDALTSSRSDRLALVYTADCVPVLVASAGGRRVAAIHAGWRGLIAGVIPAALAALGAAPCAAAIGPCLSLESCEMGPEVADAFRSAGLGGAVHERPGVRPRIDLRAAAREQLEQAGCRTIDVSEHCTYLEAREFPSHRRDVTHGGAARAGRIGALIAARA